MVANVRNRVSTSRYNFSFCPTCKALTTASFSKPSPKDAFMAKLPASDSALASPLAARLCCRQATPLVHPANKVMAVSQATARWACFRCRCSTSRRFCCSSICCCSAVIRLFFSSSIRPISGCCVERMNAAK